VVCAEKPRIGSLARSKTMPPRLVLAAAITVLATPCTRYPPSRPRSVPESARWTGGLDGGTWVDCSARAADKYNWCKILDEEGRPVYAAMYRLRRLNRPAATRELRYRYVDGAIILLEAGLALDPVAGASDGIGPVQTDQLCSEKSPSARFSDRPPCDRGRGRFR
jgi:hypothetical protein